MSSTSSSSDSESEDNEYYEHILEIDLDSLESARSILAARRATTSNFHQESRPVQEQFNLAASLFHQSGEERRLPTVRFITKSPRPGSSSCKERWLHLITEKISFESFKRHAINIAFDLYPDWVPVVMYLLSNIKDNHEQPSIYGSYIRPGTVVRCDGMERKQRDKPDVSATFISFPYFDLGDGNIPDAPEDDTVHMTRALFQQFYPKENTKDRDNDQQFRRFRQVRNSQYLRVPQLWILILNSTTIISCGPSSLVDTAAGRLEVVSEDNLVSTSQCLIHVTDYFRRVTLLTPDICGSYLALEETIQKKCLSESGEHIDQCILHLGESEAALDPSLWPNLLKDTQDAFLYIRISRKSSAATAESEDALTIEESRLPKMIEYTDLGSDNESVKGKELILYTKWRPKLAFENDGNGSNVESDTVAGAASPSISGSSTASATLGQASLTNLVDHYAVRSDEAQSPPRVDRQAAYKPFRARVDDYESSESSAGLATEDDRSSLANDDTSHKPSGSSHSHGTSLGLEGRDVYSPEDDSSSVSSTGEYDIRFWTGGKLRQTDPNDRKSASSSDHSEDRDVPQVTNDEIAASLKHNARQDESRNKEGQKQGLQQEKKLEAFMRMRLSQFGFQENQIQAMVHPERQEQAREHESNMEKLMRNRLSQFGFQENQIQAMLHPARQMPTAYIPSSQPAPQPTYARIRRDYLDIETLHYYDIPYEYDVDPNYIIVLREMSQKQTEILFEHTRRLRTHHGNDGGEHSGTKETAFRRRKTKSRSRSRKMPLDVEADEDLRIKLTLLAIKARLYNGSDDGNDEVHHSTLIVYKSGVNTVEIKKSACPKKPIHEVNLNPLITLNDKASQQLQDLSRELTFLQARTGQADTKSGPEVKPVTTALTPKHASNEVASGRRVIAWQTAKLYTLRDSMVKLLRELIGQFVPEFFDHTLIQRCWGSVETISKVLVETSKDNEKHHTVEPKQRSTDVLIVRALPNDQYLDLHNLPNLSIPIEHCSICRRERRYADIDDAVEHLRRSHIDPNADVEQGRLTHWLLPVTLLGPERKNERLLEFVENIHRCTERLLAKAIDIRSSVADREGRKDAGFLLPTALVRAAEKTFQFIYYSAYSMQRWYELGLVPLAPKNAPALLTNRTVVSGAEFVAKIADNVMSNARDELVLMAHTGESRDPVLHIRTTPETNVLLLVMSLMARPLLPGLEVDDLYREHLVSLRYEASRKPSKRLLRELYLWKEEMEVQESVLKQQIDAIRGMREVFDSDSFRITNQVRIEAFSTLERPNMDRLLASFPSILKKEMKKNFKGADKLAESLRYNIAIAEEGNSKAILIFTLVTIVFLPLSFVSSIFGMNTIDVRDMSSTQTLFWAVALPVTAGVGGLSLLAAYGGPMLQRCFQNLRKVRFEVQLITFKKSCSFDEEQPRHDKDENTIPPRQVERRDKRSMFTFTKREIALKKDRKSGASSSPAENVTLGDMFFR
ncbi:hypothetical protein E8E12_009247 [Didymella heteroderae]|uniref:DUF7896 domain-containing protein n=1 Tax=Didymella heteroderae TaxID=1769908 RepID=A0A9P4WUB3_9PLEO|nr:hypothetical protein E8E12_009247 [Didymella heteroderae]